ncbi:MAG: hypothetical protein ABS81_12890 [Pseudonocardia sp. SCN 72-86]|nr:MAG: hypothetical protein ABS81_12890 [Pseudonocardia sp. SCN 72-86]
MPPTPETTLAPQRPLRCSDAERQAAADRLRTALTEGRLTADETGERLALAATARHRHELDALVDDLPAAPPRRPAPLAGLPLPAVLLATAAAAAGALRHRPLLLALAVLLALLLAVGAASLLLDGMHEMHDRPGFR